MNRTGIIYIVLTYMLWGILPVYWKFLQHVYVGEVLASRIFWAFIWMLLLLVITKKWHSFLQTIQNFRQNKKQFYALTAASVLISANWFIYIWAVHSGQIIQASLGYYINPLVSVLLGRIVLKEKLSPMQSLSFVIALTGVLILTISYGQFPWIALSLALSFGLYGLVKKLLVVDSEIGLTLETMIMAPISFIYIIFIILNGTNAMFVTSIGTDLLLIGAGAVTALPLLLFAKGVKLIPLSMTGFLQYFSPTIMLLLGVFVYHEIFSFYHFIAFVLIWLAISLYSISSINKSRRLERHLSKGKPVIKI
ncbi:EamA family transporter RarD [Bacillaceae bacterium Marseille-Q3522]|nr:EamA family transporter RarD [Bacillaceae bacterium Marseille-Q3522]